MAKGVANVWVPVQVIEQALDFYQNTLCFQPIKRDGPWAEIDAAVADLRDEGVDFPAGLSEHDWGKVAYFKHTEGNDLHLYELPR